MTESSMPDRAKNSVASKVGDLARFARTTSAKVVEQAGDVWEAAVDTIGKFATHKTDPYAEAIAQYKDAFTVMNDKASPCLDSATGRQISSGSSSSW